MNNVGKRLKHIGERSFAYLCCMTLTNFTQQLTIPTSALDVYTVLMDERRHSSFTSDFAHIQDQEGTAFSLYDGQFEGKNEVLERGKKIIWSFKVNDPNWPLHHYSEAALILQQQSEDSCTIELFHTAIPAGFEQRIEHFWNELIWEPLTYYLER
jgi:activator of HSP90 ATPase